MPSTVDLLVPGLLGPVPPLRGTLTTPTLDLLLDRATVQQGTEQDPTSALLARFGVAASAPYALATDDPSWDRNGFWLHADPVHLRPDRDLLRLFDAAYLGIDRAEADALVAELNRHFAGDGLHFSAPRADRWYVRCERDPGLHTTPLARVRGEHIDGFLPTGDAAARWASLMSEAQMLLFQSPVNGQREAAGRPAVNGLWCWGGGHWAVPEAPLGLAVGSEPLLRGLAQATGIEHRRRPGADAAELAAGCGDRVLVLWDALGEALRERDEAAWAAAAADLELWLQPLPKALRRGDVAELRLDTCDGHGRLVRGADLRWHRRLLRRPRTLQAQATPESAQGPDLQPPSGLT